MVRKNKRASNPPKEHRSYRQRNRNHPLLLTRFQKVILQKLETMNEIKIKQEENLDTDEEKLQPITIIKNDIRFEDLQTFFQKYNLEIPIETFIRNFEKVRDSFNISEKQKNLIYNQVSRWSCEDLHPITIYP
ncbi:hypothetical protein TNCV_2667501 [Trichonephila clavipes]|nr:hypothetical protein TNCV_2667501 [Trichonephila clavipes]